MTQKEETQERMRKEEERKETIKNTQIFFRISQALCLGIFSLGLSMVVGDLVGIADIPISSVSITTTIFGLMGSIITGILSKTCENW